MILTEKKRDESDEKKRKKYMGVREEKVRDGERPGE